MNLSKKQWIGVAIAIIVVVISFSQFFGGIFFWTSSTSDHNSVNVDLTMTETQPESLDSVVIRDIKVGNGEEAQPGLAVAVHYTGRLDDGTVFDSSVSRGVPFQFILGIGQVIRGWDVGVVGMKVGGKRQLIISPEAAYGDGGIRNPQTGEYIIPQKATLTFEVELLGVGTPQATQ